MDTYIHVFTAFQPLSEDRTQLKPLAAWHQEMQQYSLSRKQEGKWEFSAGESISS